MPRGLLVIFTGLITSLFLFPFNLPIPDVEINTKLIMAVFGAGLFLLDRIQKGPVVSRGFLGLTILCATISVWGFFVTMINGTSDSSFAKYLISVLVWLSAAYAVYWLMRAVHGDVSLELISDYLIAVCTVQCLVAYGMTIWPSLASFIDGLMGEGEAFMSATEGRLHGLGAALDPAGLRFSAVLVAIAYLLTRLDYENDSWKAVLYLTEFTIVTVLGNMIARTTTIGNIVAIALFIFLKWPRDGRVILNRSWAILGGGLLVSIIISVLLYNMDSTFREYLRFGFEGFFSLAENGKWEVRSNELLKDMMVWPETLKTWIIGDGLFDSPDIPDRFGQVLGGFYMQTDIGYLRFIFYFGVIGLLGMISAFVYMTITCVRSFPQHKWLFFSLLLINLLGWFKVSSDIIMVFAPFLILAFVKENEPTCISSTT
jgi:hypothetical protein